MAPPGSPQGRPKPPDKALWWKAFDAAERAVGPRVEQAMHSTAFLDLLGTAARAQARVRTELEARSRRLLHAWNLPAASDVVRLHREVGELNLQLRRLRSEIERAEEAATKSTAVHREGEGHAAVTDGDAADAGGAGRADPPGRGAQRPPGP